MAGGTLKEAIRIVLETEGREGVEALRSALAGIGDVSAETLADTDRLLESLAGLNETAAKTKQFAALKTELEGTTKSLDEASAAAIQLSLQIKQTDKPSKEMLRNYKDVRKEVTRLEAVQSKQAAAQSRVGAELLRAGVDTRSLADANKLLRTRIDETNAALHKQVDTAQQQSARTKQQRVATEEADAAFRKFAKSGQVSAEALDKYRRRTDEATAGSKRLAGEGGRLGSTFSRLRGLVAPVLAFLSFRSAIGGIKNLAGVGAAAENARRALGNLYGTQDEGNRAYAELNALAKRSGLIFSDVLNDAKKLKAFGLDPLNGSYQAMVDQNAAVGGSQEDLSGKVLALGQAWAKQKLQGEEILQLTERGVSVWDALATSTGKSVIELQKLSAQGKLGRDVIRGLYEEIGRQNSGAAERSLGSLTGLLSQASARWLEFRQKVADAGVTDYLKQQVQSLIGSTTDMDALAKRVSAGIIGTLEALKKLGQQIALIGKPIASAALALAKHADAVVLLGKVYVALKLTKFTNQFIALTRAQIAATAATQAATAAEARRGFGVGKLVGLLNRLPKLIKISLLVAGLDYTLNSFIKLNEAIDYRRDALSKVAGFERSQNELLQEQLRLGQQLQSLYQNSSEVVVKSAEQISNLTKEQAQDYRFALEQARQYFGGVIREARASGNAQDEAAATDRWQKLGVAIDDVNSRIQKLGDTAAANEGIKAFVTNAVANFDELYNKSNQAQEAVSGIFDGLDLAHADGLKQAVDIIDQVNARGIAASEAIKGELRKALIAVSADDLPALKAAAQEAFGEGTAGAKLFADEVDRINLTRLGVDIEAIKTGFTKTGRAAVDAFEGAISEIDKLGLTAEQRSQAIAQAFDNAFKQANTKAELQALRQSLIDALSAGDLGFAAFKERITETDKKLEDLAARGKGVGQAVAAGADTAGSALDNMAQSAQSASTKVEDTGAAADDTGKKSEKGAQGVKEMSFAFVQMSDTATKALIAQNKFAAFQDIWLKNINAITGEWRKQKAAIDEVNSALDDQLATFDPLNEKVKQLQQQYEYVDEATLRSLAEKQQRLEQERDRVAQDAKRAADEAKRAKEEAAKTAAEANATPGTNSAAATTTTANRPAVGSAAIAGSGQLLATLRVQIVGGGSFDLEVAPSSVSGFLDELRRSQSVSIRGAR